jgi:hypothetical protein
MVITNVEELVKLQVTEASKWNAPSPSDLVADLRKFYDEELRRPLAPDAVSRLWK